jgi:hypothetical protein
MMLADGIIPGTVPDLKVQVPLYYYFLCMYLVTYRKYRRSKKNDSHRQVYLVRVRSART